MLVRVLPRLLLLMVMITTPCWASQQRQDPLSDFLLDFLERKQPTSTILYYSRDQNAGLAGGRPVWLDVALLRRLQLRLQSYITVVPLPPPPELERHITTVAHQSTSHVIVGDDDVSVEFLFKMKSRCMWDQGGTCLILSRGSTATDKLTRSFVPIDNELLVAEVTQQPGGVTSVDLVEVFHLGESSRRAVIANWSTEHGLGDWDDRSIFLRRGDWQGLHLNVASIKDYPYTELTGDDANLVITGIIGDVWTHLSGALNFTYTVQRSVDGQFGMLQPSGNWTGLVGMLTRGSADVAVAALGVSDQRNDHVDFTRPIVQHMKHVFLNRPVEGDPISGAFLFVFHWTLLLALAVCTVLGWWAMAAMYWLERRFGLAALNDGNYGVGDCLVMSVCALFQQGPDYNPDGLGSRFLLWTLFVAMFMINASYSAVLTSYLTVKNEDIPIHNFDEFVRDGTYTLAIQNNTVYLEDFQSAKKKTLQQIYEKHLEVMPDSDTLYRRMETDKKLAYLDLYRGTEDCNLFSFIADDFSPLLAMAMQDESPYRIFFNYHLVRLEEAGILDRLDRQWTYVPGDLCEDSNVVVASMPTVFTAFTALGVGVAASVALLTAEVFWFRRKRDRARARELLRRWGGGGLGGGGGGGAALSWGGGGGQQGPATGPAAAVVPWRPAQAAAKFKSKEQTAKTGLFLQRMQKLQQQNGFISKQTPDSADRPPAVDASPTENHLLLEDALSMAGERVTDSLTRRSNSTP